MTDNKCNNCNYNLSYNMKYCPFCGTPVPVINVEYSSSAENHCQPKFSNDIILYPKPVNELITLKNKKKGLKSWHITSIICSVVTIFISISLVLYLFETDAKIEFSTGSVENGYYVNKWANLSFPVELLPENNKNNVFEKYEHTGITPEGLQFGYVSLNKNKNDYDFILAFEWVGDNYTQSMYISLMSARYEELFMHYPDIKLSETVIAGETYSTAMLSSIFVTKYIHVKIIDDYAVCFITEHYANRQLKYIQEAGSWQDMLGII